MELSHAQPSDTRSSPMLLSTWERGYNPTRVSIFSLLLAWLLHVVIANFGTYYCCWMSTRSCSLLLDSGLCHVNGSNSIEIIGMCRSLTAQWCKFGVYTLCGLQIELFFQISFSGGKIAVSWEPYNVHINNGVVPLCCWGLVHSTNFSLESCWRHPLVKHSKIHCPIKDPVNIQRHCLVFKTVTTTNMRNAADGSWSFPVLQKTPQGLILRSNRERHPSCYT